MSNIEPQKSPLPALGMAGRHFGIRHSTFIGSAVQLKRQMTNKECRTSNRRSRLSLLWERRGRALLHSSIITHHSSFFNLHSSIFILQSSFFNLHSSIFILQSSFSLIYPAYSFNTRPICGISSGQGKHIPRLTIASPR